MRFFTSDHHFGHANVIKYCARPFADVDEMNEALVANWNATVGPEDEVFYLGDFSLNKTALLEFAPRLQGRKHLIVGNHDHCHPVRCRSEAKQQTMRKMYYDCGFETILLQLSIVLANREVVLHHMPYRGDHGSDERYPEWRPQDNGLFLLCGHVHEKFAERGRQINVGVDVRGFKPVSELEIAGIIKRILTEEKAA
jgi:calcineurin-like phosphoesterase family protein